MMPTPIQRLEPTESKKIIKALKEGTLFAVHLSIPIFSATFFMLDSDLGDDLKKVYGKQDGVVQGKYRRAQVFLFEMNGERLLANCEKGDRGSAWTWIPKDQDQWRQKQYQYVFHDQKEVSSFFPRFICQLAKDLKLEVEPVHAFDEKIQATLTDFLRAPLESLPEASSGLGAPSIKNRI